MGPESLKRLNAYIEARRHEPFSWGRHDCFTFTNGAWEAMHGHGWAEDWAGEYLLNGRPLSARRFRLKLQAKDGVDEFTAAIDGRLKRVVGVPPRGALLASARAHSWLSGVALGISIGQSGVFLGKDGLEVHPIEYISGAWV
jgi:hypothetical protein